jgi:aconitate hydratase
LWFDPSAAPRYTQVLTIDLATVGMHVAGPTRPQDLLGYGDTSAALARVHPTHPKHPVAIAAITSCTNTTDPRLLVAAGLLARKARALGLSCPPWVKTSLAPGSPAAASYLKRAGLLADLEALGFGIVGYGCTTCIGNPGPLTPEIIKRQNEQGERAVAILSGNRNFPGRVHPDIELSFIMSPALVIAFGLAGDGARNLQSDPVQVAPNGQAVYLRDIWPSDAEIDDYVQRGQDPLDYARDFRQASKSPLWLSLASQSSPQFKWDVASTALRPPPFAKLSEGSLLGHYRAYPLLVLGDDVTTDHISPASAIPPYSLVADFLVSRGDSRDDLNVFASRRGNWEVMMRAAFHNKTLKNLLAPHAPVAHTLHQPSGAIQPIWDVAASYAAAQQSTVIVAGERYGMGSSRDWAAKGQRLLGVRAVLAMSFERIHRSNLIGMGILPLVLSATVHPNGLKIQAGDQIEVQAHLNELAPRGNVSVIVHRKDGSIEPVLATAGIETQFEIDLLRDGGVIPYILKKTIRDNQSL